MNKNTNFPIFFRIVGVYDILLGLTFIFFYKSIFAALDITLPNHSGYIFVPAFFVICGGVGEFLIAKNLLRNVDLVIVRLLMKLSFAGVIIFCYFTSGVPKIFLLISVLSIIGVAKNLAFLKWAKTQIKKSSE